ncbi:transient receptor potential cation channel subfamily M member 4-like [Clarias magur]|uniref:Transient receptor potential cation channel subfamily M member 4-like n=1 Tax=Clarias magur TaxID=1594786 RepID=A0A8J4WQI0_CLAMG|nr:transient receptor potential cation channel subfamily M member 4-like [Clarias magur]
MSRLAELSAVCVCVCVCRVDNILKQLAEIREQDRRLRMLESELEYCSSSLSWITEELSQSETIKCTRSPPAPRAGSST